MTNAETWNLAWINHSWFSYDVSLHPRHSHQNKTRSTDAFHSEAKQTKRCDNCVKQMKYSTVNSARQKINVQQPLRLSTSLHDAFMMQLARMLIDLSSGDYDAQIMAHRCEQTECAFRICQNKWSTTSNAVNCDNWLLNCLSPALCACVCGVCVKWERLGTSSDYCDDGPKGFCAGVKLL